MPDFHADLNKLLDAAAAWQNASVELNTSAEKAGSIQGSHAEVVWGVFQEVWTSQVKAAEYMKNRLTEARDEASAVGNVLTHVATVFREKDENFANVLIKLQGEQ
ncbi:hypothetical protein DFR70_102213 [Nocardia tenerifensis]|uniref:Excreted virulence factor EspC (Type VII ESX diderm) n=1 Tax=Nocardia tenerifensis TaxID=228006 RepID=A0A318KUW3_9NOCA|nr:hypothetical protein [Nocardia tenerifensis]PXX68531.1 hypothetical protein DFR70_102213 [Nocardia tenerifensis]